jgi:GTPase KRas protein
VDNVIVHLRIEDTNGSDGHFLLSESHYRNANGFLLVYSIIDRSSFEQVNQHMERIQKVKDTNQFPMILVGNKLDLNDDRVVSYEEGKNFARDCNIPLFMECSAKTGENVEQIFIEVIRLCRNNSSRNQNQTESENSKKCYLM